MTYGKTLLTNLFYLLILGAFCGLWYVQYHHYAEEIAEKKQIVQNLETQIDELKEKMREQELTLLQETRTSCNKEIEQYTIQIQDLKNKYNVLNKDHNQIIETLSVCEKNLKDASTASNTASTDSIQNDTSTSSGLQCPSASNVNQFLSEGQWSNPHFNWWFEFAFRPLQEDETVKKPFKVLFDGTYIDCYYHVGKTNSQEIIDDIWVVIKGMSPDSEIQIKNGWEHCVEEGCERKCEYKEGQGCYFELQAE